MHKFTIFDFLLLSILSFSTLLGGYKGAVKLVFSLIVLLFSTFAIDLISPFIELQLAKYLENILILNIISSSISFIILMIIFSLVSSKLTSLIKIPGILDNFLGLFLGFIRGTAIILIIYSLTIIFFSSSYTSAKNAHDLVYNVNCDKYPEWLKESVLFEYLNNAYNNVAELIPSHVLKSIVFPEKEDILKKIDKKMEKIESHKHDLIDEEFEIQNEDRAI